MIEIDRRMGAFGTVRVFERSCDGARLYCIGASVQTMADAQGVSLFGYVHAAKLLIGAAQEVLIIGGAGGSLATMLARRGKAVTIVDIDPVAEPLARAYFQLDPKVEWINADALEFIGAAERRFDAVFIDACDEQGLIAPFAKLKTLRRARSLLRRRGSLLLNLVTGDGAPDWGDALAGELAATGAQVTLFRPEQGWEGNELILVRDAGGRCAIDLGDVSQLPAEVRPYLTSLRACEIAPARHRFLL